jgi:hypothetical protein
MKLVDCTVYLNKPKGGIPGTLPGVYEGRAWRAQPEDHLSLNQEKLTRWVDGLHTQARVLMDVEPIFNTSERLNSKNPTAAFRHIEQMLRIIRKARPDVGVWVYTGGRFWGYVDNRDWNQHPQMLLRYVLVGTLRTMDLCMGLAHEAYPPRWTRAGRTVHESVYDEDRTVETMGIFFARLNSELEPWMNGCPIMPVLGTLFQSGQVHHPMPASTFRRVREQCANHFKAAMVWGGVELDAQGRQKRLIPYPEHAAFFEEMKNDQA